MRKLLVIALVLVMSIVDCTSHRQGGDRFAGIRSKIADFLEEENVPSVSVAVAMDGKIVWEEAMGLANREKHMRATPDTKYEIASIAKVFTVTALMVLKEKGLIDIDAPVATYLGDVKIRSFGADPSGVTIRRIIQHTSGLPMLWGAPALEDTTRPVTQKELLERYAILAFKPGERELYSNLGIGLLIHIIETVSKKPFGDFLRQEVLLPLGLTRTERIVAPDTADDVARQYLPDGKPWTYTEGMYTTPHDMLRFGMFHLKNHLPDQQRILADSTLDLMQTAVDPVSDFRLPWWVWEYNGYKALVFTGASGTIMALVPEADLAVVVFSNRLQGDTPRICKWICEEMLDGFDRSRRIPTHVTAVHKTRLPSLSRSALGGMWTGQIITPERAIDASLDFPAFGSPQMRMRDESGGWGTWVETMPSLRGSYSEGIFSAYFPLRLKINETRLHDHWIWLYVGLDRDTLRGYAVAHAAGGPHFGLPYFIRLVREHGSGD